VGVYQTLARVISSKKNIHIQCSLPTFVRSMSPTEAGREEREKVNDLLPRYLVS
jgi:hypothetical protein